MKKLLIISSLILSLNAAFTQAATVEVTFTEPDKYIDIRPGEQNSSQFEEDVFYNLEKQLKSLAKNLPEDQLLKINFTNIDLAGDITMSNAHLVRVVKDMYPPLLKFTYQLLDKDKKELKKGEENIRDTSFLIHQRLRYKNDGFGYEKQLLDEWFNEAFKTTLAKN